MNARAIQLNPNGDYSLIELEQFGNSYLHSMYNHIGCQYVEAIQLIELPSGNRLDMWIDDEGALLSDPVVNASANLLLMHLGVIVLGRIHGVALLAESTPNGETVGLADETVQLMTEALESWRDKAANYYQQRYGE